MARAFDFSDASLQNIASILQDDENARIAKHKHGKINTPIELFNELFITIKRYYKTKKSIKPKDVKLLKTFLIAIYDKKFAEKINRISEEMVNSRMIDAGNRNNPQINDIFEPKTYMSNPEWVKYARKASKKKF